MSVHPTVTRVEAFNQLPARRWLRLSIGAALIAWAGSVVALATDSYALLTPAFLPQALAQDLVNIVLAAPALVACAVMAMRGSARAYLVWLGVLAFTVYNYVIYVFSIDFGALYPLWTAVLGLCLFALIGGLQALPGETLAAHFQSDRAARVAAWVLLVVAGLFALIWLKEDLPALIAGAPQQSAVDLNVPTNPVHTLDYIAFLPGAFLVGVGLLRQRALAYPAVAAFLVFMVLTCVPILVTPFVQAVIGQTSAWGLLAPIGILAVIMLATVAWFLATLHRVPEPR